MLNQKISQPDEPITASSLPLWNQHIDHRLEAEQTEEAIASIRVVLHHLPRHLPTYQRLLKAAWQLQRWDEGIDWGTRLLRADPGNPIAWSSVAMGVEQKGNRAQARSIWQRAFEAAPYEPAIRMGLSRTTLHEQTPLALNPACLATIYLRTGRWERAAKEYDALIAANVQRNDFLLGKLTTCWKRNQRTAAYKLSRYLIDKEKNLLLPWVVLNDVGDVNDRALAYNPIQMMDPDGEYVRTWYGDRRHDSSNELTVTESEVELLDRMS